MSQKRKFVGEKFGKLTVIEEVEPYLRKSNGKPRRRMKCLCDCGNEKIVFAENLTRGATTSCGCYQKEAARKAKTTHGCTDTRLYNVWYGICTRCYCETANAYARYGGRGIKMCDEWKTDYGAFMEWAYSNGYDDSSKRGECTIDRIDNDGDYSPENCRLVPQVLQMNNVSYNHHLTHNGETHTAAEWGRITGIPASKIINRVNVLHWSDERALTTN